MVHERDGRRPLAAPTDGAQRASRRGESGGDRRRRRPATLVGNLAEFRGYDVCQLLSMTGATGTVRIAAPGVRGEFLVDEGRIVGAHARPNPRRLGQVLRRQGAVTEAALASALERQIGGYRGRLGEFLVERGALDQNGLERALVAQAEAALTALLILPVGHFAFVPGLVSPPVVRLAVDPQALVLNALARIDELRAADHATP